MIKLCVATQVGLHKDLTEAIEALRKEVPVTLQVGRGRDPAETRNMLIDPSGSTSLCRALDGAYSHYLIIDEAVVMTPRCVADMLDADKDVVGLALPNPVEKGSLMCGSWSGGRLGLVGPSFPSALPRGVFKADWVSDRAVLAKREALEDMLYPWWHSEVIYSNDGKEVVCTPHDIGFCMRAAAAGREVHAYYPRDGEATQWHIPQQLSKATANPKYAWGCPT